MSAAPLRATQKHILIPVIVLGLLFAGYSALWLYGAGIMEEEVDAFIADQEEMGRTVTFEHRKIKGYPLSLRTQLDNFTWEDPGVWSWSGETIDIVTLPHDVTRLGLSPRRAQTVTYQGTTYQIEGVLNVGLKQDAYDAHGRNIAITDGAQTLILSKLSGHWDLDETGWVFTADFKDVAYTDKEAQSIDVPYAHFHAHSDNPYDERVTIEEVTVALSDGETPPPTIIGVTGSLALDGFQQLVGSLSVSIQSEAAAIRLARRYALAPPNKLAQIQAVLSAMTSGGTKEASVNFRFKDGGLYYGPLELTYIGPVF